jgi:rubrerythrin
MHNIPDDPKAVVETAIANEIEGHKILENAKESSTDPLARATFEFLASEELHHIELIKDYSRVLAGDKSWNPDALQETSLATAAAGVRGIFERFASEFESATTSDDQRLEIYKVAMDMEHRGYDFYSGAARKMTDEDSRKLFEFLAKEEQRHFKMIQDTHDFLDQPDGILAMEERWMQT